MPTPFMHLRAAHRFLTDNSIDESVRLLLGSEENLGSFLLGNVAPDARVSGGLKRENTHFFEYRPQVKPDAAEAIFEAHPALQSSIGPQRAFVSGYIAHLAMDVAWCEELLFPHFFESNWGSQQTRFLILHVLLCYLDFRDYRQWDSGYSYAITQAQPNAWLPFLSDEDLLTWRDVVARQIIDGGSSETAAILAQRVRSDPDALGAILEDEARLQREVWDNVSRAIVAEVEESMYQRMRATILNYITGT